MDSNDLLKNVNIEEIADKGTEVYESLKDQYEPDNNGKFLAIDIDSRDVYMAEESADAVQMARAAHPEKVFYVVKIGFQSAETMAHAFIQSTQG